jgi:hypothetical protein
MLLSKIHQKPQESLVRHSKPFEHAELNGRPVFFHNIINLEA